MYFLFLDPEGTAILILIMSIYVVATDALHFATLVLLNESSAKRRQRYRFILSYNIVSIHLQKVKNQISQARLCTTPKQKIR